jgi:hypothetical protein
MRSWSKISLFGAVCGAILFASTASHSAVLSGLASPDEGLSTPSLAQQAAYAPPGKRCIKWTRRWNTRHGFGHRRCVQWR